MKNEKGQISTPDNPCGSKLMLWIRDVALKHDSDDCLIWPFARNSNGYGSFGRDRKKVYAHRYICELVKGPPPTPKHHAAHSCDNGPGACVNQRHLDWKTNAENQRDRERTEHNRPRAKLTAEQVQEIRALKGIEPPAVTAERYGIGEAHARQIQTGYARPAGKESARQFSEDEVRAIRRLGEDRRDVEIAAEFKASPRAIARIRKRLSYRHIPELPLNIQQRPEPK